MNQLPIDHVIRLHGILAVIISDSGPQVTLRVWKEFCIAIGPNGRLSSGFQLQTNGQIERANQEQEAAFGVWYQPTSPAETLNSAVSTKPIATGLTLFEASLGDHSPLLLSEQGKLTTPSLLLSPNYSGPF